MDSRRVSVKELFTLLDQQDRVAERGEEDDFDPQEVIMAGSDEEFGTDSEGEEEESGEEPDMVQPPQEDTDLGSVVIGLNDSLQLEDFLGSPGSPSDGKSNTIPAISCHNFFM